MSNPGNDNETGETPRRFNIVLFIIHPRMAPAIITAALGMEGHIVHPVGQPRRAPNGRELGGVYRDTRWRHIVQHTVRDQHFSVEVGCFVEQLKSRKIFLVELLSSGGQATLLLQFLGDGYLGDDITPDTVATMADLKLGFGVEVFTVRQN